jgi:hypothetical protein
MGFITISGLFQSRPERGWIFRSTGTSMLDQGLLHVEMNVFLE